MSRSYGQPTRMSPRPPKAAAEKRYRLLPALNVAALGTQYYLYDGNARHAPTVSIPTQRVSKRVFSVISTIRTTGGEAEGRTLSDLRATFCDDADQVAFAHLLNHGYLEEVASPSTRLEQLGEGAGPPGTEPRALKHGIDDLIGRFRSRELRQFFYRPRVFNLPSDIDDDTVDVACVGVPFASSAQSVGAAAAPTYLRLLTQSVGFWFNIYQEGVYSEAGMAEGRPRVLCKGVGLRDFGDLGASVRTVGDLFTEVRAFVDAQHSRDLPIIYIGGDHAITFPIVDSYTRHFPDLCLIHLDAHNDAFYSEQITFHHATPISSLLLYSDLAAVYSFGLRTDFDSRVLRAGRILRDPTVTGRLHLYSIGSFKRLLADRNEFERILAAIGKARPCYLTIDLDVLSPGAVANQLSTPAGVGIEWWELFEAVVSIFSNLTVVACDVVEFNPSAKAQPDDSRLKPAVLLLLLIDGLSRRKAGTK